MIECPKCGEKAVKWGKRKGIQRYRCGKGHLFSLKNPSLEHGSPSREAVKTEPQPQPQEYDQPQDVAEEIIRESQKPKEPEPKPERNPKEWNSPSIIGDYIAENLGSLIADVLNKTVFKPKEKEKTEQEGIDFI
jgi:hypothetical protein